jgi:hypothetical protein
MALIDFKINGNSKTKDHVLLYEIQDFSAQDSLSKDDLKEIERRLWNLRIFSDVGLTKKSDKEVLIEVSERWTTIPIVKFSSGGGSTYYALGAYDINTMGRNIEVGAQYESLNNRNAGVLWFRKPQLFKNRNLKVGADLWDINRVQRYYDPSSNDEIGALTLERKRLNTFIEYRWDQDFYSLGAQFDYQEDQISDFGLSDDEKVTNADNGFDFEEGSIQRFQSLYLSIGRLNYQNYLVHGMQAFMKSSLVNVSIDKDKNLSSHELKLSYYKLFENHKNFAWQFHIRTNNLNTIQNKNYLGGLSEIRGYMDGQYFDNSTWQNNIEQRFDLYEHKYGVIQGAIFTDQAKDGEDTEDLFNNKKRILLSSGFGVRLISPKIYRFVARFDYAQTHTRNINRGFSFGVQQFF